MKLLRIGLPLLAMLVVCCITATSWAALGVPGNFQTEAGTGTDWTPATAPAMTDLTGGLFELTLSGLTTSSRYEFKILDDGGIPPFDWNTSTEVPNNGGGSPNSWFAPTAGGDITFQVDRNTYNDGFLPATDRIVASTDDDPNVFVGYYATGNWETEAGGTTDFSGGDPLFQMTNAGGNLWSVDVTISVPGSYAFKATADGGDPLSSFLYQWGTNGRLVDSANFAFTTVAVDQEVTFMLDLDKGAISLTSGTFLPGDTDNDLTVEFEDDFGPIRDNWLRQTFLRAEGNLDNTGDSEGVVDITDFRQWKDACTMVGCATGPMIAESFALLGASVPEPSSMGLALVFVSGLLAGGLRRNRGSRRDR